MSDAASSGRRGRRRSRGARFVCREWWSTVHPEPGGPACHGLADPPEADESEDRTEDVAPEVLVDPPTVPPSGSGDRASASSAET